MKAFFIIIVISIIANMFFSMSLFACSVFCIDKKGDLVVGHSYDWYFTKGYFMVNKRGQDKKAFYYWGEDQVNLARWTSKYGSITENQYGRDIAYGGMNEAGLVVYEQWLSETVYPSPDERAHVSVDQYVQYMLDNFATIDEVIACDTSIRIRGLQSGFTTIHFFAADASGNCVIIDFLNGSAVYHSYESAPVKAMTNNTYQTSITLYEQASCNNRFYRIAERLENYENVDTEAVSYAFEILDNVRMGHTLFQTVYDIKNRKVYAKSVSAGTSLRYFDFDAFDFSCKSNSKVLDINTPLTNDVTNAFIDYTTELNEELIIEAWANLGFTNVAAGPLHLISWYPETFICNEEFASIEVDECPEIKIYLTPSNNTLQIEHPGLAQKEASYEIIDLNGKIVQQDKLTGNTIEVSKLIKGTYLLNLNVESEVKVEKFVLR